MTEGETHFLGQPTAASLEQECDRLITRHQVRVSLEAKAAGVELTTEQWIERVVDRVAADLMPRYGLGREQFLELITRVYQTRSGRGA